MFPSTHPGRSTTTGSRNVTSADIPVYARTCPSASSASERRSLTTSVASASEMRGPGGTSRVAVVNARSQSISRSPLIAPPYVVAAPSTAAAGRELSGDSVERVLGGGQPAERDSIGDERESEQPPVGVLDETCQPAPPRERPGFRANDAGTEPGCGLLRQHAVARAERPGER